MLFGQIKFASAKRLDIAYQTRLLIDQSLTSVYPSRCKWQHVTALPCGHGGQAAQLGEQEYRAFPSSKLEQVNCGYTPRTKSAMKAPGEFLSLQPGGRFACFTKSS